MNRKTIGVVLAGGMSSRMGCDKKEIVLSGGKSFLHYAIDRLASRCEKVVVAGMIAPISSDSNQTRDSFGKIVFLKDAFAFRGPLCGLLTALQWAVSQEGTNFPRQSLQMLMTPVDMPNLTTDDIDLLLANAAAHHNASSPKPTIATFDGIHHDPMVGIYPEEMAEELKRLAQTEHKSLYRWLACRETILCTLSKTSGMNMNTPEDLSNLAHPLQPISKPSSS